MVDKPQRKWAILLFSLPFTGVGFGFLLFSIIPSLYDAVQMSDWHETQATVISSELKSYSGDSTTYEAVGSYSYTVAGQQYTGTRLGISGGADNVGDWHQRMSGKLYSARNAQRPVSVYYAPGNPAAAIVDRSLRWNLLGFKMIFVLVFGGAGIGIFYLSIRQHNRIIETPEADIKPWLGHKDWSSPTVLSDAKNTLYLGWVMTVFWNLISVPLLFVIPEELGKGNSAILLAGLFPAVGLGLLVWATRATRRWLAVGATPLTLDPYPGSIGGQVAGSIETNLSYSSSQNFPVNLSCLYSYMSGSGKDRKRRESVKWSAEGFARAEPYRSGSRLLFCFDVPEGLHPSEHKDDSYYLWRLNLKSDGAPVDINRNFELPVFATAEVSRLVHVDSASHPLAQDKRDARIDAVMDMQQTTDGLELTFPVGRNAGSNAVIAVIGLVFFAAGMLAGYLGAPIFFPIVFGLIGGGIMLGGLYSLLNGLRVRIGSGGLHTRRSLLGVIISKSSVAGSEIQKLRIHKTGSVTSGTDHKLFFAIRAHLKNGKKITVAESLVGRGAAEQVAEALAFYSGFELDKRVVTIKQIRAERLANKAHKK